MGVAAAAVEQVEIQERRELAHLGRDEALEAELGLADAEDGFAILAAAGSPGQLTGILEGRSVAFQSGSMRLKS